MKKGDRVTRERVVSVAARLFASRGFKKVTVREICRTAGVNVAAVNYHFGNKLGLYRGILEKAVEAMRETNEAARLAGEGRPPDQKLRAFVRVYVHRTVASRQHSWIQSLMSREIADRTAAIDLVVERVLRPRAAYLAGIVAEILHCASDDERVVRAVTCVQSQCLAFVPNPVSSRLHPDLGGTPDAVDALAEHLTAFSLAGIRALRTGRAAARRPRARRRRTQGRVAGR
jgi:AcrR family transcriptional regulator